MKRKKNPAAVALGRKGGLARSRAMSDARKSEIASMGGKAKHARIKRYKMGA